MTLARSLVALAFVAASAGAQAPPAGDHSLAPLARVDSLVTAEMQRQRIPGVAVAIVKSGQVALAKGYGHANVEHQVPVTDETIFQSGSLGKMFTSAAVMLQVEDGRLALSDPITKFFPDAPATWNSITVRHLLTHTSGIPDYTTDAFDYRKDYSEDELAKLAFALQLEFPAGARWNYSNTGYALLGFIVRRVSGKFYGDVLVERVFRPIGMNTARIITEADIVPHRAAGYRLEGAALKNQQWVSPVTNTTADGSLYFSLRDMLAWESAVKRRAILKPESWELILTPVTLNSGKTYPYGFGWFVDLRGGQPYQSHGGAWQGFKTQFSRFLGDDLSIIVLANLQQADPGLIAEGIASVMNPKLAIPPLAPIADNEPKVVETLYRILDLTREGKLTPAEFAYVRAGFFPGAAKFYEDQLKRLGKPTTATLLQRTVVGDDHVHVYELAFPSGAFIARLGLAPDGRVSAFSMSPKR